MTVSRSLWKPLEKIDFSKLRKNQGPQEKAKVELKNPRSCEKSQKSGSTVCKWTRIVGCSSCCRNQKVEDQKRLTIEDSTTGNEARCSSWRVHGNDAEIATFTVKQWKRNKCLIRFLQIKNQCLYQLVTKHDHCTQPYPEDCHHNTNNVQGGSQENIQEGRQEKISGVRFWVVFIEFGHIFYISLGFNKQ